MNPLTPDIVFAHAKCDNPLDCLMIRINRELLRSIHTHDLLRSKHWLRFYLSKKEWEHHIDDLMRIYSDAGWQVFKRITTEIGAESGPIKVYLFYLKYPQSFPGVEEDEK